MTALQSSPDVTPGQTPLDEIERQRSALIDQAEQLTDAMNLLDAERQRYYRAAQSLQPSLSALVVEGMLGEASS